MFSNQALQISCCIKLLAELCASGKSPLSTVRFFSLLNG